MILVTGASGFVGRSLVDKLVRSGRSVIAAARELQATQPGVIPLALGDLAGPVDWDELLAGVHCVVHCAARAHILSNRAFVTLAAFRAVNRDATLALAQAAARAGVKRFVFLSSIKVSGERTWGHPFSSADPARPQSDYGISKWEAEQGLADLARSSGLEVVVIRPPLVLGEDAKGNLGALRYAIAKGIPLPFALVTGNRRDLISLDVLIDVIIRTIDHPDAPGGVLLVSDGCPLSTRQIIERIADTAGRTAQLIPVPPILLRLALSIAGKRAAVDQLLGDLEVNISDTIQRLDWQPGRIAST